jgi:2-oxoacid:acceptor oxidoreductase gamma subunit (pyruvate/2-ketoisovalerate family)
MIAMTLYGRGGQGGVTLAKLIATAYFLRGKESQAFGVYAAERSGAPIQAYVRVDDEQIEDTNQIREPDHVIVLDPTLIGESVLAGARSDGWLILNTARPASSWPAFRGRHVATVDATAIAVSQGLGTRSVPIVNTTMLGAVARVLGLTLDEVDQVLGDLGFRGPNVEAARQAFDRVAIERLDGEPLTLAPSRNSAPIASLLSPTNGAPPAIRTGSWATRRPERRTLTPPCNAICPAGNDVQRFVAATARGDYDAALAVLLETTPFPGVCGRVCPAPCMANCNRNAFDEGVNVRELERFVADHARWPDPITPWRSERVAVVGSGPAGLSAAYQLARLGYHVSLFEASDELGGVLRNGIPDYRLPKEVLDRELGFVLMHGVIAYTDSFINAAALAELRQRYDAVFVGTGLQSSRTLDLGAAPAGMVTQGIDFLDRVHRHEVSLHGERVVVVGGGNTAIDAARSALRLGASSVRILYRRTRVEMPAIAAEVDAALEEGVILDELVLPVSVDGDRVKCVRMLLGEPDEGGRRAPIADPSSQFDVACDTVILAVGQGPVILSREDGEGPPAFFIGDFETNEGTVAAAIGSGRRAAMRVAGMANRGHDGRIAGIDDLHLAHFAHAPRRTGTVLPPVARRHTFAEVHGGLADAAGEAGRCFSCGVCNSCDRCRDYCPEGILTRLDGDYRFNYDYCKGCGICAVECPRGVVVMGEL